MTISLGFEVNVMKLYNGRHSVYAKLQLLSWRLWIQRWDNERAPKNRLRSGDMGWTWGLTRRRSL